MKIQLRDNVYTTVFGGTRKKSCGGCAFLSWDEGVCTALVPIYKLCPPPGKVFQYLDTSSEVFYL